MAQFIEQLRLWVEGVMLALGYPGLVLVIVLENLFPPIPSTVIMPFAGFLVSQGQFSFVGVVLAGTLGSLISAVVLYYLGRWLDETLVHRAVSRYGRYVGVSEAGFQRGMSLFDSYGPAMVFFGRFIGTVRSLISIPAGMRRMPLAIFLPLTALGSAMWNGLLAYAGMVLGQQWESVLALIARYDQLAFWLFVAVVAVLVLRQFLPQRTRRAQRQP